MCLNPKILAVACVFLVVLPWTRAYEPVEFVSKNPGLLTEGEKPQSYLTIRLEQEKRYFVVFVEDVGNELSFMVPLYYTKEEIVRNPSINKQLFKTAYFMLKYTELKKKVNSGEIILTWFITKSGQVKNASIELSRKKDELALIPETLKDAEVSQNIVKMQQAIDVMLEKMDSLAGKLDATAELDASFMNNTLAGTEVELVDAFKELRSLLEDLQLTHTRDYKSAQQVVKGIIATSDLPIESKSSLQNMLRIPESFLEIVAWTDSAEKLQENISTFLNNASSNAPALQERLETRLQRLEAYNAIYGEDSFPNMNGIKVTTLNKAAEVILHEENMPLWAASSDVKLFKDQWNKAVGFFKKGEYKKALEFANRAKRTAKRILSAGLKEESNNNKDFTLIYVAVGIIIAGLLAGILIVRKRAPEQLEVEF